MTEPLTDEQLRERIAEALMRWADRNHNPAYASLRRPDTVTANARSRADAVLAVVQPEIDLLRAERDRLHMRLIDVHDVLDDIEAEENAAMPPDDTTYGGVVTRVRNAAGFRPAAQPTT